MSEIVIAMVCSVFAWILIGFSAMVTDSQEDYVRRYQSSRILRDHE